MEDVAVGFTADLQVFFSEININLNYHLGVP